MGSIGGQDAGLKLQIDHLTAQLTEYQAQNANLRTQLSACLGSQAGDTSMIASLQVEIQSKTTQITSLTSQLATCQASLANCVPSQAIPDRVDCGDIEPNTIYPLIQSRWPDLFDGKSMRVSSGKYHITTIDSLMAYVVSAKVSFPNTPYIPTFHDCPDFALALLGKFTNEPKWWGTAFGYIVIQEGISWHAINIAFAYPSTTDRTLTLYLIEPQSAQIATASYVGAKADFILLP